MDNNYSVPIQTTKVGVDWTAFWLSVIFSGVAAMTWWQMLLGNGPALEGPKFIGSLLYGLVIAVGAVIFSSPLAYIYARSKQKADTLRSIWKFCLRFLLVAIIVGVVSFLLLSAVGFGGAGGYGLLVLFVLAGAMLFIFIIKAILLSLLLAVPEVHRKKTQYILLAMILIVYVMQFFGYARFGLIE